MMMGAINSEGEKDRPMIFGISKLLKGTDWIRFSVLFSFFFPPELLLEHSNN